MTPSTYRLSSFSDRCTSEILHEAIPPLTSPVQALQQAHQQLRPHTSRCGRPSIIPRPSRCTSKNTAALTPSCSTSTNIGSSSSTNSSSSISNIITRSTQRSSFPCWARSLSTAIFEGTWSSFPLAFQTALAEFQPQSPTTLQKINLGSLRTAKCLVGNRRDQGRLLKNTIIQAASGKTV